MTNISLLESVLVPVGAALLGAIAGGVIPAQLQHARAQRYAVRALQSWTRAGRQQLSALLQAIRESEPQRRFTFWQQLTLEPMSATERSHHLQSLPEWLDNIVLVANVRLEQLRVAVSASLENRVSNNHDTLIDAAERTVVSLEQAESALTYYLDRHSELFGDHAVPTPEKWRADQRKLGRDL